MTDESRKNNISVAIVTILRLKQKIEEIENDIRDLEIAIAELSKGE